MLAGYQAVLVGLLIRPHHILRILYNNQVWERLKVSFGLREIRLGYAVAGKENDTRERIRRVRVQPGADVVDEASMTSR